MTNVAVTSRSFSKHELLRTELTKRYQNVTFNEAGKTLVGSDLIEFLSGHSMAIVGLERLDAAVLLELPELKVISRFGVGLDTLDLNLIKQKGIKLASTRGANKRAVAELVVAFALVMLRQLSLVNRELLAGIWMQRKGQQLSEKTIGLIGLGAVGKEAAHLFKAFDCKILAYDLIDQRDFCNKNAIQQMELDDLLKTADIISLHLPLTDETKLILNKDRLQSMKQTAILINTARGNLVDEVALKELLQTQCIGGAAFDVFANEPPADRTLLGLANFFATPHIGGSTDEAILAMGYAAIAGLESAALL